MNKKNLIVSLIYLTVMIIFLIGSFIVNLPVLLLISVYALTITTLTVQYDHWILNSLSKPFTFTYTFALIQDFIDLNFLFAVFHIPTVISCYLIIKRKDQSLILMLIMSFIYGLWILLIKTMLYFPFYNCVFFVCEIGLQILLVFIMGVLTSFISARDKFKDLFFKEHNRENHFLETKESIIESE